MATATSTEHFCVPNTTEGCGNGICNEQGTYCACFEGYVEDFTQMMFPNCYLLRSGEIAFLTLITMLCFVVLCVGAYMLPKSRGLPRAMTLCAISCSVFEMGHLISLGIEGKPGIPATIFLIGVHVVGGCLSVFILLWSFVSPTLDLMMLHGKQGVIQMRMKLLSALFIIQQIAVFTPALIFQYRGDYRRFNIIYAWQLVYIAVYALMWAVAVKYYSSLLFLKMDEIIQAMNLSESVVQRHRMRLGLVVSLAVPLIGFTSLVCGLLAGLYLGLGVHPYRFVIYIVYMLLFPTFNIILLIFSRKRPFATVSTSDQSKHKSKDLDWNTKQTKLSKNDDATTVSKQIVSTAQSDAIVVPQF